MQAVAVSVLQFCSISDAHRFVLVNRHFWSLKKHIPKPIEFSCLRDSLVGASWKLFGFRCEVQEICKEDNEKDLLLFCGLGSSVTRFGTIEQTCIGLLFDKEWMLRCYICDFEDVYQLGVFGTADKLSLVDLSDLELDFDPTILTIINIWKLLGELLVSCFEEILDACLKHSPILANDRRCIRQAQLHIRKFNKRNALGSS